MKRIDKVKRIGIILDELYPETPIPLNHTNAYTLLVAVMLSAQTTDKKVNEVTPDLFKYAKTPEAMVLLSIKKIQSLIQKIGLAPTFITDEAVAIKVCVGMITSSPLHISKDFKIISNALDPELVANTYLDLLYLEKFFSKT